MTAADARYFCNKCQRFIEPSTVSGYTHQVYELRGMLIREKRHVVVPVLSNDNTERHLPTSSNTERAQ